MPSTIGEHFAYPFALTSAGAGAVVQDSDADVFACVRAITACPIGARDELPEFGIPYPAFVNAPVDTRGIEAALMRWEPRASERITEYADLASDATRHIDIQVSPA